jgi:uncharacterized protein
MDKFRNEIEELIKELSDKHKFYFASTICMRLFPNYQHFSVNERWGNPQVLENCLGYISSVDINNRPDNELINKFIANLDSVTPDTNDFKSIHVSFAVDACNSILETLNYILTREDKKIVDIATFARDTVDLYVQEIYDLEYNNPDFETIIEESTYMVEEKGRQFTLLHKLNSIESSDDLPEISDTPIIDLSLLH